MITSFVRKADAALKTFKGVRRNGAELFVKKISWVTGALELTNYFSQFGKVTNITLPFDLRTGLHKGFAFISFENNDFCQNIRKFEGKHIIDDEEVICFPASKQKSLLLTVINATPFDCESNSEMDFSKASSDNGVKTVTFIEAGKTIREKKVKCETNPETISINDMNFQNCKVRADETNLLRKLRKADVPKERSKENSYSEKAVVSAKFKNLVRENKKDSGMNTKAYIEMLPLRMNVARNGFSGWIGSPNRNFGILTTEITKQKYLKHESNSDQV